MGYKVGLVYLYRRINKNDAMEEATYDADHIHFGIGDRRSSG
jgi:hypothetical protein